MTDPAQNAYPSPGEILDGKYRVEKLLGEGGMGAVARATHLLLHRTVAVKFMNPQFMTFPGAVERFLNEGRASGAIRSDHVVPVSDVGCLPTGTPYLVMECLYGLDLADLLAREGPGGLPVQRAVHFVLQILRGLQAAHAIGIIHRDMKPSNCFVVTHDGEEDFVKILDFGISKIQQPGSASLTQTNSALGTPLYMSPEQARSPRDVDARSDLYSVGVILYELLSGRTPFFSESGEFTEILFQLFTADPPPIKQTRPDLPDALAQVVHKALAREVPDRYATAVALAEALEPFAGERSLAVIDRMRAFKPPTTGSMAPMVGLPTSLAAFSQLQRGHGTDVMANRPTTDVQRGPPVTEVIAGTPNAMPRQATELLSGQKQPPAPHVLAVPPLLEARASPSEALGRTQLEPDPRVGSGRPGPSAFSSTPMPSSGQPGQAGTSVQTDLGAARDAAVEPTSARSPLVFAIPLVVVLFIGLGATGLVKVLGGKVPKAAASGESPPSMAGAVASHSSPSAPNAPNVPNLIGSLAPSIASVAPSSSASGAANGSGETGSGKAGPGKAPLVSPASPVSPAGKPPVKPPSTHYDPGLDPGLHN